jgi:hypothetical protein
MIGFGLVKTAAWQSRGNVIIEKNRRVGLPMEIERGWLA